MSTDPNAHRAPRLAKPILVLGATGKTGRPVVARLRAAGLAWRAGSRHAAPPFDWTAPDTWHGALAGVEAVYVAYQPDLAIPGASETVAAFAERAVVAGVRRLVLLAGRGERGAEAAEQAVRQVADDAGVAWTVVRASWFAQNFSESFLQPMVVGGCIALPAGDVPEPFVDCEDIADVAVAALTSDAHAGRTYDVTGPALLTFAEAAAELSRALGRPVRYAPIATDAFVAGAQAAGVPAETATALGALFAEVLDGRNAHVGDGVQRALGRPPRTFATFVRRAAEAGAWGRSESHQVGRPASAASATAPGALASPIGSVDALRA